MDFTTWLQMRLVAHGRKVTIDGALGAETRSELRAFQRAAGLKESGVGDKATVAALRLNPAKAVSAGEPAKAPPAPAETMPPWMAEFVRRIGLHESRNKAELEAFMRAGKFLGDPSKAPWCGDAMESAVVRTLPGEVVPVNPFWAQGWAKFGVDAGGPIVGAVGVIAWTKTTGHVGVVVDYDAKRKRVLLLGGNTSDTLKAAWFARGKFIAFRWPKTFPKKTYPPLSIAAATGTSAGTR